MTRLLRHTRLLVLAGALGLAACGSESTTEASIFGTYNVTTIDGHALPVSELDGSITVTFISGSVTLKSDQTFTRSFSLTEKIGTVTQPATDAGSGTFSVSGSAITLVEDGETTSGTLQGSTLTVTADGRVYVLKK